ncbi:MAG TPA: hypothetical protein VLG44_01770 [Chlamydiales bacterium]|nr:hypothetical protein [Chlamydiales bacterium]
MRSFFNFLFVFIPILVQSSCPYGCGDPQEDGRIQKIARIIDRTFEEIDFKKGISIARKQPEYCALNYRYIYPMYYYDEDAGFWRTWNDFSSYGFFKWESNFETCYSDSDEEITYEICRSSEIVDDARNWQLENYRLSHYSDYLQIFSSAREDLNAIQELQYKYFDTANEEISKGIKLVEEYVDEDGDILCDDTFFRYKQAKKVKKEILDQFQHIENYLCKANQDSARRNHTLDNAQIAIEKIYAEIWDFCIQNHECENAFFERSLQSFLSGNLGSALEDIRKIIQSSSDPDDLLISISLLKGKIEF